MREVMVKIIHMPIEIPVLKTGCLFFTLSHKQMWKQFMNLFFQVSQMTLYMGHGWCPFKIESEAIFFLNNWILLHENVLHVGFIKQ